MKRRAAAQALALAPLALAAGCSSVSLTPERKTLAIDGPAGRLHVEDGGSGPRMPVLLVHGFAGDVEQWRPTLRYLREARRAVAFDLRGHGRSDAPVAQSAYAVDAMTGDVAAVADALGLKRFVLVGHSLGGALATAYAARHAQRVAGLVLVGAPGRMSAEQSLPIMSSLRADYAKTMAKFEAELLQNARPETDTLVRKQLQRVPRETALAIIGAIFSFDPTAALRAYPGPKLIIDAAGDGLHTQHPQIPHRLITGTSHWPQLDKPREFNALLGDFVASVQAQVAV